MKPIRALFGLFPVLVFLGCSNPADNVPAASVSAETNAAPAAATAPREEGRTFVIAPESSKVEFVGSKVTGSHNGGFKKFTGEIKVVNGKVADQGNKVVIDTASLFADNDRLTGHLKSPDFFDVAKYPTSTFETTSVRQQGTNYNVTGNLTLHGITKQISFPAMIQVSDSSVNLSAVFFIDRFDFDIKYAGKSDDLIRKEVVLKLSVNATPGKANFAASGKPAATCG